MGANHASTPPALTPLSCFWFCLWCCFWFCKCWFELVEALQQVLQLQEVAEVLLGEVLPLVLLELWHGWEGHGGVERGRNLGSDQQ